MLIRFFDYTNPRPKRRPSIENDFEYQMNAASFVFSHNLTDSNYKQGVKQLNLFCSKEAQQFNLDNDLIDGFWDIVVPYDPNIILKCPSEPEKKNKIEKAFAEIFYEIYRFKGWDLKEVDTALQKAAALNFRYEFFLKGTPKKSPDRSHFAIVKCVVDITSFKMTCLIYDKSNVLVAQKIFVEAEPSPFAYQRFLGNAKWKSESEFSVEAKLGSWVETIKV